MEATFPLIFLLQFGVILVSLEGYLEDRRPAANCDPYAVATALVETICLGISEKQIESDSDKD